MGGRPGVAESCLRTKVPATLPHSAISSACTDELSYLTLAAYAGIMLFSGLVHGTLGLGFPLVATPLLALFTDVRSAILITLLPTASVNIFSILRGGRWSESIGRFWPLAAYVVAGGIAGTCLLVISNPAPLPWLPLPRYSRA